MLLIRVYFKSQQIDMITDNIAKDIQFLFV